MADTPSLVRILARLDPNDPAETEQLLAQSLGDELFRIASPPLLAYDLHAGDIVRAVAPPGQAGLPPVVVERVLASGHRTLRVYFADAIPLEQQAEMVSALHLVAEVRPVHGWDRFWTLDLPPDDAGYKDVCDQLHSWESAGLLRYETGAVQE